MDGTAALEGTITVWTVPVGATAGLAPGTVFATDALPGGLFKGTCPAIFGADDFPCGLLCGAFGGGLFGMGFPGTGDLLFTLFLDEVEGTAGNDRSLGVCA